MYFAAGLNAIALLIALFVQTLQTPLAGAWLLFLFAGCAYSYRPSEIKPLVWKLSLAWLVALGISTFLLAPVINGAAPMWILAAMPMIALSIRISHLRTCIDACGAILVIYAVGLIIQVILQVHYTNFEYHIEWRNSAAAAWPMLDPNNAAVIVNAGLIPSFYMALRQKKWFLPLGIFCLAMIATASKAGGLSAFAACAILLIERFGFRFFLFLSIPALVAASFVIGPVLKSFRDRLDIWGPCLQLLWFRPFTGVGLGQFSNYYNQIRTEHITGGWFAHNDILQIAIEMGLPAAFVFLTLVFALAISTTRRNIVASCMLLAVFLQSLVEFQFYVPAVSIVSGLALAYHINNGKGSAVR